MFLNDGEGYRTGRGEVYNAPFTRACGSTHPGCPCRFAILIFVFPAASSAAEQRKKQGLWVCNPSTSLASIGIFPIRGTSRVPSPSLYISAGPALRALRSRPALEALLPYGRAGEGQADERAYASPVLPARCVLVRCLQCVCVRLCSELIAPVKAGLIGNRVQSSASI